MPPTPTRAIVYVNQVGGQDELVFDGGSFVFDAEGNLLARAPQFVEDLLIVDVPVPPIYRQRLLDPRGTRTERQLPVVHVSDRSRRSSGDRAPPSTRSPTRSSPIDELYEALVLGTRDYCRKNGFTDVVIGLSGGIDSTIVAVHRRRRARRRARARRVDAVALLVRPLEVRRPAARREPRHRLPHDLDRAGVPGVPRHAGAVVRGPHSRA